MSLRPPHHAVDPRCVTWWRIRAVTVVVPVAALSVLVAALASSWRPWSVIVAAAVVGLGTAYTVQMPRIRYRIHRWEVTEDAVYTKSGWLTQDWRVAPMSRIQTVDSSRGPLQQSLGLATVRVTTASAAGSIAISALDADAAAALVHHLTVRTQQTPEDGT